jgi:hypothetical protein
MEKKLSIVIIPLVTTFIGVGVPLALTTGGGDDQGSLAAAGLAVTNEPDKTPRIDLLLRNTSEDVAVIDRVEFRVLDFERSEGDNCPKGGADIPVSETYELVLPAEDGAGRTATIDTAQQLRPGEADRFSFRASLDDPSAVWLSENPLLGEARFFQLEAHVYHDGEPKPLLAGQAILAVPFPFTPLFAEHPALRFPGSEECVRRNNDALNRILSKEGERSAALVAFAAEPGKGYLPGPGEWPPPRRAAPADYVAIEEATNQFLARLAIGDYDGACRLLPVSGRADLGLGHDGCAEGLASLVGRLQVDAAELADAHMELASAGFGSAQVNVRPPSSRRTFAISLGLADGWRVLGAYVS